MCTLHIPLSYEHLFYKYYVPRSVGQATKGKRASLLWMLSSLFLVKPASFNFVKCHTKVKCYVTKRTVFGDLSLLFKMEQKLFFCSNRIIFMTRFIQQDFKNDRIRTPPLPFFHINLLINFALMNTINVIILGRIRNCRFLRIFTVAFLQFLAPAGIPN